MGIVVLGVLLLFVGFELLLRWLVVDFNLVELPLGT